MKSFKNCINNLIELLNYIGALRIFTTSFREYRCFCKCGHRQCQQSSRSRGVRVRRQIRKKIASRAMVSRQPYWQRALRRACDISRSGCATFHQNTARAHLVPCTSQTNEIPPNLQIHTVLFTLQLFGKVKLRKMFNMNFKCEQIKLNVLIVGRRTYELRMYILTNRGASPLV